MDKITPFLGISQADYSVTPFVVNKRRSVTAANSGSLGVVVAEGQYTASTVAFLSGSNVNSDGTHRRSVYDLANKLYYGRWVSASSDTFVTSSAVFDSFGTHAHPTRSIDTNIQFIGIPQRLYGERIKANSFTLTGTSATITDDGHGNLLSASVSVGNIFYEHGNVIITNTGSVCQNAPYGSFTMTFDGIHTVYEYQVTCHVPENELTMTTNPTNYVSGSGDTVQGLPISSSILTTGWAPYITTIGFYNDNYELLMLGKLATPIKNDPELLLAFTVHLDM